MKCSNTLHFLILFCFLSVSPSFASDIDKTFANTKKYAEQGDVDAQYSLGLMYDNGEGVAEDDEAAAKWYRLAAEQGDVNAQYNLGVLYFFGEGVAEDKEAAAKWYRLAAEQGNSDAQYELAYKLDNGGGVPQANLEVEKLYKLAAEQGHEGAAYVLKIGQKIGLKEEPISGDLAIKHYNEARQILLDAVNKSGGIATEHNQRDMSYKKLADEDRKKLINQIKTCSDYLYFENWNGNFQSFHTGHPSWATYEILLDISYQRISTNGCRAAESYKILEPKVDYKSVYDLAEKLSKVDKNAVRYVLFNLISKGLIEKPNYSLAYDLVTRKSDGYDSSVLIRWGQRLLAENGTDISIDGNFGPSTCLALNTTLNRDKNSVCGNTFQKNDILELVALK